MLLIFLSLLVIILFALCRGPSLIVHLHHVYTVQVLLQSAHVGCEVLHLCVDCIGEVLNEAVKVVHLGLDTLQASSEDETEVCLVLWHLNYLVVLAHVLLCHLLLLLLEAIT